MKVVQTLRPQHVREANERAVLAVIQEYGRVSRADLSRHLRISKPTTWLITQELVDCGLLVEDGYGDGALGRRPTMVRLNESAAFVVAIQILGQQIVVVLADLAGRAIKSFETTIRSSENFESVVQRVAGAVRAVVLGGGVSWDDVPVLSIACPGVLDPVDGCLHTVGLESTNLPSLEGQPFVPRLEAELGVTVVAENDVNAAALGERWWGMAHNLTHFAYAYVGCGVSLGLVLNGELYRGKSGAAGEIGCMLAIENGAARYSTAGANLESLCSDAALVQRLARQGGVSSLHPLSAEGELSLQDIYRAAAGGDAVCGGLVSEQARHLAAVLAPVCATLDLERVIVGSVVGVSVDLLAQEIGRFLGERGEGLVIPSALDGRASVLGAIGLAVRHAMHILPDRLRARRREAVSAL